MSGRYRWCVRKNDIDLITISYALETEATGSEKLKRLDAAIRKRGLTRVHCDSAATRAESSISPRENHATVFCDKNGPENPRSVIRSWRRRVSLPRIKEPIEIDFGSD